MTEAQSVQWLNPRVAVWGAYEPAVKCDLCSTALVTRDGLVLIDPISLAVPALTELVAVAPPHAIMLTNGNHTRAADALRERLGVPVFVPRGAEKEIETRVDVLFPPDETGLAGITPVPLRSAGPGEVALLHDGTLIIGDALINLPSTGFAVLPAKYCADAAALPGELRKLCSLLFNTMTFAHGAPLTGDPARALEELLA